MKSETNDVIMKSRALLCFVLVIARVVTSSFLSDPFVKWTYQLPGSGEIGGRSLRMGNAVVVSKYGAIVFATADDGSLHVLSPDLDFTAVYEPPVVPGTYTECRSGVSLFETDDEVYAVYSVVDLPITAEVPFDDSDTFSDVGRVTEVKSRVIAVNVDGSRRWSINLSGYVVGTPVIGHTGRIVYVSTNVPVRTDSGEVSLSGRVQIIRDNNGKPFVTANKFLSDRVAPFGPLGIRTIKINGGDGDLVFFSESLDDGFAEDGRLYFLTPSATHGENSGNGADSYDFTTFSDWGLSSVVRPTMSVDGLILWTGGTGSVVAGWPSVEDMLDDFQSNFPVETQWEASIAPSERNESQPLINSPVVSADSQHLYINSVSNELVCLDALSGEEVWTDDLGASTYLSEPKLSSVGDRSMLYTIEVMSGRVRQHDALTGARNWEFDCSRVSEVPFCQDSVEAEFSISPDGNELYYGDVFGNVIAMQVAEFVPTPSPTSPNGGTKQPTVTTGEPPTPTASITEPVASPSSSDDNNDTLLISAISVVSFLVVAVVGMLLLRKYRRRKTKRNVQAQEEENDRRWKQEQRAWEESCRKAEQTTIAEIKREKVPPTTPSSKRKPRRKSSFSPRTPQTLASIEEVDDEWSVNTDQSLPKDSEESEAVETSSATRVVKPLNLDYRFAATTPLMDDDPVADGPKERPLTPVSLSEEAEAVGMSLPPHIEDSLTASPSTVVSQDSSLLGSLASTSSPIQDEDPLPEEDDNPVNATELTIDFPQDEVGGDEPVRTTPYDELHQNRAFTASSERGKEPPPASTSSSLRINRLRASWNSNRISPRQNRSLSQLQSNGRTNEMPESHPLNNAERGGTSQNTHIGGADTFGLNTHVAPSGQPPSHPQSHQQSSFSDPLEENIETIAGADRSFFLADGDQSETSISVFDDENLNKSFDGDDSNYMRSFAGDSSGYHRNAEYSSSDDDSIPPPPPPPPIL